MLRKPIDTDERTYDEEVENAVKNLEFDANLFLLARQFWIVHEMTFRLPFYFLSSDNLPL